MQSMLFVAVVAATIVPPAQEQARTAYARGVAAWRAGRDGEARTHLLAATKGPILTRDHATFYAGLAAARSGRHREAARLLHGLRDGPLAVRARWHEAAALFELGRKSEAKKLYGQPGEGDRGLALFRSGQQRRLVVEEPDHPLSAKVNVRLAHQERIERARNLIARRQWQRAAAELDKLPGAEARYWAGMARYRTRHAYAEAADVLFDAHAGLSGARAADALFHSARALSRADRDDEAIARYREVVSRYPGSNDAAEAAFLAGWLEYNRGRFDKAIAPLLEAERKFPQSPYARPARWFAGWSRFLLSRYGEALADFERLVKDAEGELDTGKLLYWRGRCLDRLGRAPEAEAAWREAQARFPLSWYALLARQRVAGDVPASDGAVPKIDSGVTADPLILRADELIAVGLHQDSAELLRDGEAALMKRHGGSAIGVLIERYQQAGDWNRVYQLGSANKIAKASFPLAYRNLIDRYGPPAGNPDLYLYAIMRKESGFGPGVASYADAQGLLQMIPATSRRVAPKVGLKYRDGMLYEPEANVRLGAWYIGRLLQKFSGQVPLGAGSYNAGPKPVMRWCDRHGQRPMDEFVELIPFEQTREYTKKVTANYARYLHLYQGRTYQLAEKPACKYAVDDLDY